MVVGREVDRQTQEEGKRGSSWAEGMLAKLSDIQAPALVNELAAFFLHLDLIEAAAGSTVTTTKSTADANKSGHVCVKDEIDL